MSNYGQHDEASRKPSEEGVGVEKKSSKQVFETNERPMQ